MSLHLNIVHSHLIIVTLGTPPKVYIPAQKFHLPLVYGMYTFEDYSSVNILYTPSKTTTVVLVSSTLLSIPDRPALLPFPS